MTPLPRRIQQRTPPSSPLEHAREKLHVSTVPNILPCREKEFADIMSRIEEAIEEKVGTCLYISGTPKSTD